MTPPQLSSVLDGSRTSRLGAHERGYLSGTFAELCRIQSPSGQERSCAQRIEAELRALGVQTLEDNVARRVGSECGNLLAHIPARDGSSTAPSILLCAHMDTTALQASVEPVLHNGAWENQNKDILGADNKAAIAVLLALARHVCLGGGPPLGIELLFTVCGERAQAGARALDATMLHSELGYVFDHAAPIGEIVTRAPCRYRMDAVFRGVGADAWVRPEEGRSAILAAANSITRMPHGRMDESTTVNLASIAGGSEIDVVPEHCSLSAEVRSLHDEHAEQVLAQMIDQVYEAANLSECDCDVDVRVERTIAGYLLGAGEPVLRAAEIALRSCGREPVAIGTGSTSDANALIAQGIPTVNLANGIERSHQSGERVTVAALEQLLEVTLDLLDAVALIDPRPTMDSRSQPVVELPC